MENENQIVSNAAYNLFYQRRDVNFEELDYSNMANWKFGKLTINQSKTKTLINEEAKLDELESSV